MKNLEILRGMKKMVFDTPMLCITLRDKDVTVDLYAKYEAMSFSGSIKDRMAYYIFEKSYENGELKEGQSIVEMTSGNTGIAMASFAGLLGHKICIVMPDFLSKERYASMELLGVNIIKVSREEGGFLECLKRADDMSCSDGSFYPDQFSNKYNTMAHKETTAKEIVNALKQEGKTPDHFVAGVGTGGTVMGCMEGFKALNVDCKCHPLEPKNSPTLSTGGKKIGSHRIQGIVDDFIPALVDLSKLAHIVSIDDEDAIAMAKKLCSKGLNVGISSGANLLGAFSVAKKNPGKTVTTVLSDSFFKYFSTDLANPLKKSLSELEFGGVEVIGIRTV